MVPVGTTGVIRKAPWDGYEGWQIRIEDDGAGAGFLILFSRDFNDREAEGYDQWAANEEALAVKLRDFEIDWGSIPKAS